MEHIDLNRQIPVNEIRRIIAVCLNSTDLCRCQENIVRFCFLEKRLGLGLPLQIQL
jgi:hypothetical protein